MPSDFNAMPAQVAQQTSEPTSGQRYQGCSEGHLNDTSLYGKYDIAFRHRIQYSRLLPLLEFRALRRSDVYRPTTFAYSSPLALPVLLPFQSSFEAVFAPASPLLVRGPRLLTRSCTPRAYSAPLSVCPAPGALSLRHAPTHLIRISATSLTGSLPPPCHSTCPVLDVGEHIVAVVASPRFRARCGLVHGRRSLPASVLQVSNATSSSQPLVPSIDKQQRCLWATTFKYEILRRFDSALALEPSLCPPPAEASGASMISLAVVSLGLAMLFAIARAVDSDTCEGMRRGIASAAAVSTPVGYWWAVGRHAWMPAIPLAITSAWRAPSSGVGHGVLGTVFTVRRNVPAISLVMTRGGKRCVRRRCPRSGARGGSSSAPSKLPSYSTDSLTSAGSAPSSTALVKSSPKTTALPQMPHRARSDVPNPRATKTKTKPFAPRAAPAPIVRPDPKKVDTAAYLYVGGVMLGAWRS
ncbi:hypothetical protein K438DRAFT_2028112 [Mycena galopus ATCC 62051]|nr:hypothetical protein K438DRAFT_2028112 [Mycena galopus ATCC 62051]